MNYLILSLFDINNNSAKNNKENINNNQCLKLSRGTYKIIELSPNNEEITSNELRIEGNFTCLNMLPEKYRIINLTSKENFIKYFS